MENYNYERIRLKLKGHIPVKYRHMSNIHI